MEKKHTIKQILLVTQQYAPNRYIYRKRDVVKKILIKEVREIDRHDLEGEPRKRTKYVIESKSFPQYYPYFTQKDSRGRSRRYQRTTSHHYDINLEMDRLSINTYYWSGRLGSGKIWNTSPPQSQIKAIYPANKKRWSTQRKIAHKKKAKYLDIGDWNSKVQGINADFIFRQSFARYISGHLWGRNYYGNQPASIKNPQSIVFFTKHEINLIEMLLQKGILKDD